MFWLDLIGTLASVAGLIVSLYVLSVAIDVKEAVEEARVVARRRSLAEELDDVASKLLRLGTLIQHQEWLGVQMGIEEIVAICKMATMRWPDHLPENMEGVRTATTLLQSIATQSAELAGHELTPPQKKKLIGVHLRASGLVNSARGEARRDEERNIDNGD